MPAVIAPSLPVIVAMTIVANGAMFLVVGGLLHHAFYVRRAERAREWRHHDEHHRSVKRCYGQTFTWIDSWLGTGVREADTRDGTSAA